MKHDIGKRLAAALISRKYKQGRDVLEVVVPDGPTLNCCLGVLTRLAIEDGVDLAVGMLPSGTMSFGGESHVLHPKVREWAGMKSDCGKYGDGWLVSDNDRGRPFEEIAQIVLDNLDDL